jgi:hypothetical protein
VFTVNATGPAITAISPNSLRRLESKQIVISGSGLAGASVLTSSSGLQISNVQAETTQVAFTVTASSTAPLGPQSFSLVNSGGTANFALAVNPVLPTILVSPAPLAIPPDLTQRGFVVRLSSFDTVDHTIALAVADPTRASLSASSLTIPAGQAEARAGITGMQDGVTSLILTSATLGSTDVPVFVTKEFKEASTTYSPLLGVVVQGAPSLIEPVGQVLSSGDTP